MADTPAQFFEQKAAQLHSSGDKLASIGAVYQFKLDGDGGGSWVIELTDNAQEVREGEEEANCTISMKSDDFMAMIGGTLNPQMAFMTGKLRVQGDMGLALKLQAVLG